MIPKTTTEPEIESAEPEDRPDGKKRVAPAPPAALFGRKSAAPERDTDLLKRLLADQRAATLRARADAADLEKQLKQARAELTAQKTTAPPPASTAAEKVKPEYSTESGLLKVQFERAKKDLQLAEAAREQESAQATAKLAGLNEALRAAQTIPSTAKLTLEGKPWVRILGGVAATVAIAGLVVAGVSISSRQRVTPLKSALRTPFRAETAYTPQPLVRDAPAPKDAPVSSDFTEGIDRLSRAFDRFPGIDPEVVMKAVNKRSAAGSTPPCGFVWNDGEPALQFGNDAGGDSSVARTLSRCAAAVERFQ